MGKNTKVKYWVASDDDSPSKIYFSSDEALRNGHAYVDCFDEDGNKCLSYMLVRKVGKSKKAITRYTTDF